MRFHRSIKIFPGLRLNLSKSGLGLTAGVRGLKVGIDAKGRSYVNAGIPGTGLSVRQYAKTDALPRGASPTLQPPAHRELPASTACPLDTGTESKMRRTMGVWALVGLGVVVVGVIIFSSQRGENSPAATSLTPEQTATGTAERELARAHPEFTPAGIAPDGPNATKRTVDGYEVQLHYLPATGALMPFVCQVRGMTASCSAPTPPPRAPSAASATPSPRHMRSRGPANSPTVYERRRR
jgi:hypothetical protein